MFWFRRRPIHESCHKREQALRSERDEWRRRYADVVALLIRQAEKKEKKT